MYIKNIYFICKKISVISVQTEILYQELNRTEIIFGSIWKTELTEILEKMKPNRTEPKLYSSVRFYGFDSILLTPSH